MLKWDSISQWGRRASDLGATPLVSPARDPILEAVIAAERVELLFQPIFAVETGVVAGAEALARSALAGNGEALFARAGAASLGERLSRLVQRKALNTAALWQGALADLRISVNLLPADIARAGYEDWLLGEIDLAGIDPARITLEITESALLCDHGSAAKRLSTLRAAGLRIAVDDFGTGYASLSYLTSLPLDMLKIDRGLIANIARRERDRIVVRALVTLARDLGLTVVAEGVESTDQLRLLEDWGCELYQGFLGAGPLAPNELAGIVARTQVEPA